MKPKIAIRQDNLSDGNIVRLLQSHRLEMLKHSPPGSVHALDVDQLKSPDIMFWSAFIDTVDDPVFAGCGALKKLGDGHGELKSMKTELAQLRKGVARSLLEHIINQARRQGYSRLSLETGTQEVFIPARKLYTGFGFEICQPFAEYKVDPYSVCMTLELL